MELPKGWRIGYSESVGPQWAHEWDEYVGKASTADDILRLRIILSDRKSWLFPRTVRKFSGKLEAKAAALGVGVAPVEPDLEAKGWHNALTDFPGEKPTPKPDRERQDITSRMLGEAAE